MSLTSLTSRPINGESGSATLNSAGIEDILRRLEIQQKLIVQEMKAVTQTQQAIANAIVSLNSSMNEYMLRNPQRILDPVTGLFHSVTVVDEGGIKTLELSQEGEPENSVRWIKNSDTGLFHKLTVVDDGGIKVLELEQTGVSSPK